MSRFTAAHPVSWPSGRGQTVGVVRITVEAIAEQLGLEIHSGLDDLDHYDFVSCAVEPIGQVWLFRYRRSPDPGTELIVDRDVASTLGPNAIIRVLVKALYLRDVELTWRVSREGLAG